jgi:O-Antigen ligase/TPR repeat
VSSGASTVLTRGSRVSSARVPALGAVGGALLIGVLAADHGGCFATSWSWSTLAAAWAAAMALLLRTRIALSRAEIALVAASVAFAAWVALSILWSTARGESVDELARTLLYLVALSTLLLLVRPRTVPHLLAGTTIVISLVSAYALATRLFPDRVGRFDSIASYRLSEPVGYWNALGVLAVLGALLALGFAVRAERTGARAAAAAALPLLLLTVEFTFSRGSWIALAVGVAAAVAIGPGRLRLLLWLLVLAPACAATVLLATRSSALTTAHSRLSSAAHEGHRLALALAGLCLLSALLATGLTWLESRLEPGVRVRRAFALSLVAVALVGIGGALAVAGGAAAAAHRAVRSFESPPVREPKLSRRLLSLSSNGRIDLWRAAWRQFEERPLVGGGAGSFEQYWRAHRPTDLEVRDAHSLYLETLAELGIVGLVLLATVLAVPFLALRHRRTPLVSLALAAYTAFLVHAGLDWDWEVPAVTLAGLACGAAALIAARDDAIAADVSSPARYAGVGLLAVVGLFAAVTLVGNRALDTGAAAAASGDWGRAAAEARSARTWLPWSSDPWRLLGDARFGRGDFPGAARAYRRAIQLDPRNWLLWFDLGFATGGRESDAAFARAGTLDPRNPEIPHAH